MTEREKVITGLECCQSKSHCEECPYIYEGLCSIGTCTADLASDALALLKEQEPKTVLRRDNGYYCPRCSTITTRTMGAQKLHLGTRYCPYCGQAVKWEC